MRAEDARLGNIVRVNLLRGTKGMMCSPEHLANRRQHALGKVVRIATAHRDDSDILVWVKHGRTTAPYWNNELDLQGCLA